MKIKLLNEMAKMPTKGSEQAAGFDLYAAIPEDVIIYEGETKKISTGIAIEMYDGVFGAVFARSGLATNSGLRPANCVGVIDSDYRGEIIVALHNDSDTRKTIHPGDRIAQLVFLPYVMAKLEEVDELSDTERSTGGFGSTGIK